MTPHSTNDSSSILENGKLKSGIYKIQNIKSETYLDIEVYTREVCCRPAKSLGEGRGFVCRYPSSPFVPDDQPEVGNQEPWGWIYGTNGECTNVI